MVEFGHDQLLPHFIELLGPPTVVITSLNIKFEF